MVVDAGVGRSLVEVLIRGSDPIVVVEVFKAVAVIILRVVLTRRVDVNIDLASTADEEL